MKSLISSLRWRKNLMKNNVINANSRKNEEAFDSCFVQPVLLHVDFVPNPT